jgi:GNAT superfamily N-acetyltransferase
MRMGDTRYSLRRAAPQDAASLAAFAARMFFEAFGADNDPKHMAAHLAATYGPELQRSELSDPSVVTLLLEVDGALAGYAMVRRNEPPACVSIRAAIELWRFYIDRPWHGRGAAQRLMAGVREIATEFGAPAIWLGVFAENSRAIAFYGKCGFEDAGVGEFLLGGDRQIDRVLVARNVAEMVDSAPDRNVTLPKLLASRARRASDGRLAIDAILGAALTLGAGSWGGPGWELLVCAGACLFAFGLWGIADRELLELRDTAVRASALLRLVRSAAALFGLTAAAALMLALLARVLGRMIS